MKKWLVASLFFLALSVLFIPSQSSASGFALPEQGTAAMGMASAFVAQADDVTAAWYNPAGLTRLDGTRVSVGVVVIYPSFKHETTAGTESIEHTLHLPFTVYASQRMSDRLSLGLSINNPFGLETNWSPAGTTAAVATLSKVTTLNTNPSIAYKVTDRLSVAAGVNYMYLDATLSSLLLHLTGDGDGVGGNASVLYSATDRLNLGFAYRSKIRVDIDGTAFGLLPAATNITLPDEYKFGVSYKTSDALTLNASADWTNWSTYNQIEISSLGVIDPKEWQDTWCFRVGGQYAVSDQWKLRAGYLYDTNPVREEYFETRVPDSDRQGPSIGAGYTSGKITVDAAYLYVHFNKRTITSSLADDFVGTPTALNGNYKAMAHNISVSVAYKF